MPDSVDERLAQEIHEIYLRMTSDADGEWKWIHQNRKSKFISALETGKDLARMLRNLFATDAAYGIISANISQSHDDIKNRLLLDIDTWREFTENNDLSFLEAPDIGRPFGVRIAGTTIFPDTPRHDYYAIKIHKMLEGGGRVLEIGGGYGGLSLQLQRRGDMQYVNCDLPESLCVSYYFLRRATGKKIAWAIDTYPEADIIFVPSYRRDLIKQSFDLVFNSISLSEMSRETANDYTGRIMADWKPNYFFHINSNFLLFPDSERHQEILARSFPINTALYSEVYRSITPWQGGGGRSREFLYKRR